MSEEQQRAPDGFEGARWIAKFVMAYADTLDESLSTSVPIGPLVQDFQSRLLTALLSDQEEGLGLLRIIDPDECQRQLDRMDADARIRLAEREARLSKGATDATP